MIDLPFVSIPYGSDFFQEKIGQLEHENRASWSKIEHLERKIVQFERQNEDSLEGNLYDTAKETTTVLGEKYSL